HVLDGIDLLLDRGGHRVSYHASGGSRVISRHPHGRGRDLRVLGDRQEGRGDAPEQDDDEGDDPRQDRPVNEEACQHAVTPYLLESETGMSTSLGSTVMPGRIWSRPLTITRSPGCTPSSSTRNPSWSAPTRMGRETTSS